MIQFNHGKAYGWIRFFDMVITWKDTSILPLMAGERLGLRKGFSLGKWRVSIIKS